MARYDECRAPDEARDRPVGQIGKPPERASLAIAAGSVFRFVHARLGLDSPPSAGSPVSVRASVATARTVDDSQSVEA
jgi:hypothetical protein